jgi:hypothetical protein
MNTSLVMMIHHSLGIRGPVMSQGYLWRYGVKAGAGGPVSWVPANIQYRSSCHVATRVFPGNRRG